MSMSITCIPSQLITKDHKYLDILKILSLIYILHHCALLDYRLQKNCIVKSIIFICTTLIILLLKSSPRV